MSALSEAIASAVAAVLEENRVLVFYPRDRAHLTTAIAAAVVEAERAEDRARLAAVEAVLAGCGVRGQLWHDIATAAAVTPAVQEGRWRSQ